MSCCAVHTSKAASDSWRKLFLIVRRCTYTEAFYVSGTFVLLLEYTVTEVSHRWLVYLIMFAWRDKNCRLCEIEASALSVPPEPEKLCANILRLILFDTLSLSHSLYLTTSLFLCACRYISLCIQIQYVNMPFSKQRWVGKVLSGFTVSQLLIMMITTNLAVCSFPLYWGQFGWCNTAFCLISVLLLRSILKFQFSLLPS